MSDFSRIMPSVDLGEHLVIDDFVIVGYPPQGKQPGELTTVVGNNATVRSHSVIYAGTRIGDQFHCGHGVLIREYCEIGDRVSVGSHSVVEHHVRIGHGVRLHSGVFVPEYSVLEEGCWVGPYVVLTNVLHPLCPKAKECVKGPTIRRGAKIGAGAIVLPALEIGENALIGAGAVVVEDVPADAVVTGNPARLIKSVRELVCPFKLIDHPYSL